MMFCDKCGKEITDDSQFCGHCGAALSGAATGTGQVGKPPISSGPQVYAPPLPPSGVSPNGSGQHPPAPNKSVLLWVLGGIALAAVIALVLVFVAFDGGESDTSGPQQAVDRFWEALEKQDVDMLLSTMEPSYVSDLEEVLGDDLEPFFEDYFFIAFPDDLEVTIRKMETEIDGDEAVVTIVDGTMTYTDEYGDEVTEEASESDMNAIPLVRVDGKWYLSRDALDDLGLNPRSVEDLYEDELDDTGGAADGEDYNNEEEELAEVEAAMIAYAEENSGEGLEFEIYDLFIEGNEAVGVAICTNQELEAPFIIMEKGSRGWYGVDFGTGWDPPVWYEAKLAEVEAAMIAYVEENASEGLEFEIYNLLIKGNEAVGVAVCTNQEVDAPLVIMERGSRGWYGVNVGTGIDAPYWYTWY